VFRIPIRIDRALMEPDTNSLWGTKDPDSVLYN
jgi:hypothetical protein